MEIKETTQFESHKMPLYTPPDFTKPDLVHASDAKIGLVTKKGVAPENYHATSMYPEYFKINGQWQLIEHTRMDCVPVLTPENKLKAVEFRFLEIGDRVILGRDDKGKEGIYLHSTGFHQPEKGIDTFAFRGSRSRETSFAKDYSALCDLLQYEKENKGYVVWVLGPAAVFDRASREIIVKLIDLGYIQALFGGNAVATHDLEGAFFNTALGQDITDQTLYHNGHYHHLDAINKVNEAGSIAKAVEKYGIEDGIMAACVRNKVPFVLAGSLRDDGPMPDVIGDVYEAQAQHRAHTEKATTIVALASVLHTIATGNLTPSYNVVEGEVRPVYIYAVDISEFGLNKIGDRGSLEVTTIVSNIQDFLYKVGKKLL